jgi:Fe-S-cluster containining protein
MESFFFSENIEKLKKMYHLYEKALADTHVVCRQGCSDCCTCNVVATSLEIRFLVGFMDSNGLANIKQRLEEKFPEKRYVPKMTTNQFAGYCVSGQEIPAEENDPDWGKCPFLEADCCTIYPARPFGCRSMLSQVYCKETGYAQVPPLALTITNIFLQYIEHLDHQGFSGNLSDMLALDLENPENFKKNQACIKNMKMAVLLVPPGHRSAVTPLLKQMTALT